MLRSGFFRRRKAVGSIIGGAFVLLIILAGYEFYILNNKIQNDYQHVLSAMRTYDIERSEEDLRFTNIDLILKDLKYYFTIKIRNDGPELVSIEQVGIFLEEALNDDPYYGVDEQIPPSEVLELELNYEVDPEKKYLIQVVTEKGNVFPISYPQDTSDYPYGDIAAGALAKVIGRVLPDYESFSWSINAQDPDISFDWEDTWSVPNKEFLIFRITVLYYYPVPIVLGKNTGLFFIYLGGAQSGQNRQFYIVQFDEVTGQMSKYDEDSNYVVLPSYDPDNNPEGPTPITLYFATSEEEGDPFTDNQSEFTQTGKYQTILAIYERPGGGYYSQAFSLIAVEVVP